MLEPTLATLLLVAVAFGGASIIRSSRSRGSRGSALLLPLLFVVITALSMVASRSSLPQDHAGLARVRQKHVASFFERLSAERVIDLVKSQAAVLIDARPADQFEQLHIKGALNISAGLSTFERKRRLMSAGIAVDPPKTDLTQIPMIVYCDAKGCSLDRLVAVELVEDGFRNVRLIQRDPSALDLVEEALGRSSVDAADEGSMR